MGGECYRYIKFKKANANVEIDESAKSSYTQLITIMLQEVSKWYTTQVIEDWELILNQEHFITLKAKNDILCDGKIIIPYELNESLNVGWQHRHYGKHRDPKESIATILMNLLLNDLSLKKYIEEDEEYNIAADLGYFEYEYEYEDIKGIYDGYDNWEDYLDANGLDGEGD